MVIIDHTGHGKVAAKIINEAGRINRELRVTVSYRAPESVLYTKRIPGTCGWIKAADIPRKDNGRIDYVGFLKVVEAQEVFIRLSTSGGASVIYTK